MLLAFIRAMVTCCFSGDVAVHDCQVVLDGRTRCEAFTRSVGCAGVEGPQHDAAGCIIQLVAGMREGHVWKAVRDHALKGELEVSVHPKIRRLVNSNIIIINI
jgi:hypothetical protein